MILSSVFLLALTSAEAIVTLLNSPASCGCDRFSEAQAIVERDAANGQVLQQFVIGALTSDKKTAEKYLSASRPSITRLAEEKNNPLAWYLLSLENNDMRMLHLAAKGGNVQALNALGTMAIQETLHAKNVSSNDFNRVLHNSFLYFERAASLGDANGYLNLGACYLNGIGCKKDLKKAFSSFKSAAYLGHPEGMDSLSAAYELGHGVEKNADQSLLWRMLAKGMRGDKDAIIWLEHRKRQSNAGDFVPSEDAKGQKN